MYFFKIIITLKMEFTWAWVGISYRFTIYFKKYKILKNILINFVLEMVFLWVIIWKVQFPTRIWYHKYLLTIWCLIMQEWFKLDSYFWLLTQNQYRINIYLTLIYFLYIFMHTREFTRCVFLSSIKLKTLLPIINIIL